MAPPPEPPGSAEPDPEGPREAGPPGRAFEGLAPGDEAAPGTLFDLVYGELRLLADRVMRSERDDHTLQPTALVHEAYLRLSGMEGIEVRGPDQFLALAARAMRRVLVDHARSRGRRKRGGDRERVALDEALLPSGATEPDVLDVDRVLASIAERHPRQAQLVELRFFGGLSGEAAARVLGVSVATVERDWRAVRALLAHELDRERERGAP